MTDHRDIVVQHEPEASRYVILVDNVVRGEATYAITGSAFRATHTLIDPDLRGQGLANQLVAEMITDIRDRTDLRVVPECSYVVEWFATHADQRDLLTRAPSTK